MATTKKTSAKKELIDDDKIISLYMTDVLKNNSAPKNIFVFCNENKIEESDFYTFFGSFSSLRKQIWLKFLENAVSGIQKDSSYQSYSDKDKLLTLYYTLFEILTLNRSYVLFSLQENGKGLENLKDLTVFRKEFKEFVGGIVREKESVVSDKITKITEPVFSEGAWVQFLFLLKFWLDDSSKGFEKTDILIEKSVNTVVGIFNTKQFEDLFDLGKFLWKERSR